MAPAYLRTRWRPFCNAARLDESEQGHGLGLGMIQDHVGLYRGKLTLSKSGYGGLCAELNLPAS